MATEIMLTRPRRGDKVRLNTPDNPRLHGAAAHVAELFDWGAKVQTRAAATGEFRALWEEMLPAAGLNGASGYTGDVCDHCGGLRMLRAGACLVCADCGTSGGCG